MRFTCPNCAKTLQVADHHAGKQIRCPSCQTVVRATATEPKMVQAELVKARPVASKPAASAAPSRSASAAKPAASPQVPPPPADFLGIDLGQLPSPQAPVQGSQAWQPPRPPRKRSSQSWKKPLQFARTGGIFVLVLVISIVGRRWIRQLDLASSFTGGSPVGSQSEFSQSQANAVSLPNFPDLGQPRPLGDVNLYTVDLRTTNSSSQPGARMRMRVYVPQAATEAKSIACVLVAPAGTNLLYGNDIDSGGYHDETLPYARAGMAVVNYSLDGPLADLESFTSERQMLDAMSLAYKQFSAAHAGVTNGRIALDFVLAKLPQVDPAKIYCAGHSSAATVALELAAHEPRIAKAAAYAPITDLTKRLHEFVAEPALKTVFPNLMTFLIENSPVKHVHDLNCPVFLFHARDDSNEPWFGTKAYADMLSHERKDCTFVSVNRGDHYDSMINEGIPKAIDWFNR